MKKQTIVIFQNPPIPCFCVKERHVERLNREFPDSDIIWCRDRKALEMALPDADVVLTAVFRQEWFELAPRLRMICSPAAGRDTMRITDVPVGVEIKTGTFHGPIMAETAVGLILSVNRGILKAYKHQLEGELWPREELYGCRLISGSHAVIVGFGRIGQYIGKMLKPFGVRVTGVRRNPGGDTPAWFEAGDAIQPVTELHSVLSTADHVLMVLPSDTGTDNFMGKAEFDAMPKHTVLYNYGRGNSVDEEALADALRKGSIAGACLDVFAEEPLPQSSPLADEALPGLLRMPHASAYSESYIDRFLDEFIEWLK